jgi:hypothetical protein
MRSSPSPSGDVEAVTGLADDAQGELFEKPASWSLRSESWNELRRLYAIKWGHEWAYSPKGFELMVVGREEAGRLESKLIAAASFPP